MSLFNDIIIDLVLLNITIQWSNKFASRWESQKNALLTKSMHVSQNCCNFVNVIWNTLRFWHDNDNNDNIRAGGGAETSFPFTVA